jgi:hypothetical protein
MTEFYRRAVSHPDGELRYRATTERGRITEFVVQLYCWRDGSWRLVAQSDHNPMMPEGYDVTTEGVHVDVFRDGEKHEAETTLHPGPLEPASALKYAINYLETHDKRLIERYDEWLSE